MAPAKKKQVAASSTLTITQTRGLSGRTDRQIATLKGLGLSGRHTTRTLQDTPAIRGMIEKVKHLVSLSEQQD